MVETKIKALSVPTFWLFLFFISSHPNDEMDADGGRRREKWYLMPLPFFSFSAYHTPTPSPFTLASFFLTLQRLPSLLAYKLQKDKTCLCWCLLCLPSAWHRAWHIEDTQNMFAWWTSEKQKGNPGGTPLFLYLSWHLYLGLISHTWVYSPSSDLEGPCLLGSSRKMVPAVGCGTHFPTAVVVSVCWNYRVCLRETCGLAKEVNHKRTTLFLWENVLSSHESTYIQTFGLQLFH